jgi:hypothetical protein
MSKKAKRSVVAVVVSLLAVVVAIWAALGLRGERALGVANPPAPPPKAALLKAAQAALEDIGKFQVGQERGIERSSFTGCPFVYVFLSPEDPDYAPLSSVLADSQVNAQMPNFTGVLIDTRNQAEAEVESEWRAQGFRVVVRGLSGGFYGGFNVPFGAQELSELLRSVIESHPRTIHRSPLYRLLRNLPEAIDKVLEKDGRPRAEWCLSLMEETEGRDAEPVAALRGRLGN